MADRFPSLDDFSAGQSLPIETLSPKLMNLGQTEPIGNGTAHGDAGTSEDFLARERAALGDDASRFASAGDNATTAQDGDDDDLLGGGGSYNTGQQGGEEITEFESSFPAVDTRNEVIHQVLNFSSRDSSLGYLANGTWRNNHWGRYTFPIVATIVWGLRSGRGGIRTR